MRERRRVKRRKKQRSMEVSQLFLSKTDLNVAISKTASESQNVIYTSFEKIMILSARLPMLKFFCKWTQRTISGGVSILPLRR